MVFISADVVQCHPISVRRPPLGMSYGWASFGVIGPYDRAVCSRARGLRARHAQHTKGDCSYFPNVSIDHYVVIMFACMSLLCARAGTCPGLCPLFAHSSRMCLVEIRAAGHGEAGRVSVHIESRRERAGMEGTSTTGSSGKVEESEEASPESQVGEEMSVVWVRYTKVTIRHVPRFLSHGSVCFSVQQG